MEFSYLRTDLNRGDHLCHLYETDDERRTVLLAFIREGIQHQHRILMVTHRESGDEEWLMTEIGIQKYIADGSMKIIDGRTLLGMGNTFTPQRVLAAIDQEYHQALRAGWKALRVACEMSCVRELDISSEDLLLFENMLSKYIDAHPIIGLDQYRQSEFEPGLLLNLLAEHPRAMIGNRQHLNYYGEVYRQTAEQMEAILANLPVILMTTDIEGRITLARGKGLEKLGKQTVEFVGKHMITDPAYQPMFQSAFARVLSGENLQYDIELKDHAFEVYCSPLRDQKGAIQGMLSVAMDITEEKKYQQALSSSEERYRTLVENQNEGVVILDEHEVFEYANLAVENVLGLTPEQLIGRQLIEFIPEDQKAVLLPQLEKRQRGEATTYELEIIRPDGNRRHLLISGNPRFDGQGKFTGSFVVFRDITETKLRENNLYYTCTHDTLTGLYNRFYFEEALSKFQHSRQYPISIVVMDVDGLKDINDTHGHMKGDELLRQIARLFAENFRTEDIVARIGGDEFAVLLPRTNWQELQLLMARLKRKGNNGNELDALRQMISVGGATAEAGQGLWEVFNLADQRMYVDKHDGQKSRLVKV